MRANVNCFANKAMRREFRKQLMALNHVDIDFTEDYKGLERTGAVLFILLGLLQT